MPTLDLFLMVTQKKHNFIEFARHLQDGLLQLVLLHQAPGWWRVSVGAAGGSTRCGRPEAASEMNSRGWIWRDRDEKQTPLKRTLCKYDVVYWTV